MKLELKERLGWIELMIRTTSGFGGAEKKACQALFRVSDAGLSTDQVRFVEGFNEAHGKTVVEITAGKIVLRPKAELLPDPVFTLPSSDEVLQSTIGARLSVCSPVARREPDPGVAMALAQGIQRQLTVLLDYLSRTEAGEPFARVVSPHSVVWVAGRYHLRAYDHSWNRWADFVLSRIVHCSVVEGSEDRHRPASGDADWHEMVKVEIFSRTMPMPAGVGREYGINETGRQVVEIRKALAPYVVDDHPEEFRDPLSVRLASR